MALNVKDQATPRELIPAKTYLALINGIIDLGTQDSPKYGPDHKILMSFELHTRKGGPAKDSKGNVLVKSREFTLKFSKIPNRTPAALRVAVESIIGRELSETEAKAGFNLETLLGRPCQVQIKHNTREGQTYDDLDAILTFDADDDDPPAPATNHLYYELDPTRPIPQEIPQWVAKKIMRSAEWGGDGGEDGGAADAPRPGGRPGFDETAGDAPTAPFDTGDRLSEWVRDQGQAHEVDLHKYLTNWARLQEFPGQMSAWDSGQVALGYAEAVRKLRAIAPARAEDDYAF